MKIYVLTTQVQHIQSEMDNMFMGVFSTHEKAIAALQEYLEKYFHPEILKMLRVSKDRDYFWFEDSERKRPPYTISEEDLDASLLR